MTRFNPPANLRDYEKCFRQWLSENPEAQTKWSQYEKMKGKLDASLSFRNPTLTVDECVDYQKLVLWMEEHGVRTLVACKFCQTT